MENFLGFDLPKSLADALTYMKYEKPTPIQAETIPLALSGRDILGSAQTGTGKTAAFTIPLVTHIINGEHEAALVLAPTRELAVQVMEFTQNLTRRSRQIKTALLIGGEAMPKQFRQLKARPNVIIGTPGRVNDHLNRGSLKLNNASFLVLDETDRMLDIGFDVQLEAIAKHLPKKRQTLLFSATMSNNIVKVAQKYLEEPKRISIDSVRAPSSNIDQESIFVNQKNKDIELCKELDKRDGSIIVFVKTKIGAEKLSKKLSLSKYSVDFLHGDLRQSRRAYVIQKFRNRRYRIMIATDVAARGLDIPHISHVINYDLPQCPEDYIHRIGRTARAGAKGSALCLISSEDKKKWHSIQVFLNPEKALPSTKKFQSTKRKPFYKKSRSYGNTFQNSKKTSDNTFQNSKKTYGNTFQNSKKTSDNTFQNPKKTYGKKPRIFKPHSKKI